MVQKLSLRFDSFHGKSKWQCCPYGRNKISTAITDRREALRRGIQRGGRCSSPWIAFGHDQYRQNVTEGCFNSQDLFLAMELFYWKQPERVSREGIFTDWQISDEMFWNKNAILKFWENFKTKFLKNFYGDFSGQIQSPLSQKRLIQILNSF